MPRRSASSGSSNSRSVTAARKAAIASSSIKLLSLALHERTELCVLVRRHLGQPFLPLLEIGRVEVQLLRNATLFVELKVDLFVHLIQRIEKRPASSVDDVSRRFANPAHLLVEVPAEL